MRELGTVEDFLDELATLYHQAKSAYILLEENNSDQSAYMGPINEFRNALDHIMKIISNKNDIPYCRKEYDGAKRHLLRAGSDSYEFACSEMIIFIGKLIHQYTGEEIVSVLPNYYEMRLKVIEVQEKIAEYRTIKELELKQSNVIEEEDNDEKVNIFNYYRQATVELIEYTKAILNKLPFIVELHKKNTRVRNIGWIIGIVGAAIGIAGIIIALVK